MKKQKRNLLLTFVISAFLAFSLSAGAIDSCAPNGSAASNNLKTLFNVLLKAQNCNQNANSNFNCFEDILCSLFPNLPNCGNNGNDTPTLPEKPETPVEPEKPVEPETPVEPEKPVEPETPVEPEKPETPDEDQTENEAGLSEFEAEVLRLVNAERAKVGAPALKADATVTKAARIRAQEISKTFSHTRPNGSSCFSALDEVGYSYNGAGENIAYGYETPESVMRGWMNSEGHKRNILNEKFTTIGIGCYNYNGTLCWTQMFTY